MALTFQSPSTDDLSDCIVSPDGNGIILYPMKMITPTNEALTVKRSTLLDNEGGGILKTIINQLSISPGTKKNSSTYIKFGPTLK